MPRGRTKNRDGIYQRKDRPGWWASWIDAGGKRRQRKLEAHTLQQARTLLNAGKAVVESPAIFKVWRPQRVEKILAESQRGSAEHKSLEEKGIVCVFVDGSDPDHQGSVFEESGEDETDG
jgi:hypothetical protein